MKGKKEYCTGCDDDFYNGNNDLNIKECLYFKTAKVVKRLRIGWWTPMDKTENYTEVLTNDCHKEPGRFAFL